MPVIIPCDISEVPVYLAKEFTRLWYSVALHDGMVAHWRGRRAFKCPMDMWVYQELITETTPDVIIECGTHSGGSALFFADMCELSGRGTVISIDVAPQPNLPPHPRIRYITASSTDVEQLNALRESISPESRVMVILDSDHHYEHVLKELRAYQAFVTPGCYLVVEDTNYNGHPILPAWGWGPMEAVGMFLRDSPPFDVDRNCERFLLTSCPNGFLKRREDQTRP